jgi:hypothetical protein
MRKQRIFDPRDPDYDGPDDTIINDEPTDHIPGDDLPWLGDDSADDYIMTDREIRGEL